MKTPCTIHPGVDHYNWLTNRLIEVCLSEEIQRYATGVLVDIGCGIKPYVGFTKGLVTKHIGVDHIETLHDPSHIDIVGSAYDTTLPEASADTVLCTEVLEHLEKPQSAMNEMQRILRPGGYLILTVPLFWHLHEEPRDFYRYTKHGLAHLFSTAELEIVKITPLGGFIVTFAQELCYYLEGFRRGLLSYPIRFAEFLLQWGAYQLYRMGRDRADAFTCGYLAVARKKVHTQGGQ